jgi:hypothetical protein
MAQRALDALVANRGQLAPATQKIADSLIAQDERIGAPTSGSCRSPAALCGPATMEISISGRSWLQAMTP